MGKQTGHRSLVYGYFLEYGKMRKGFLFGLIIIFTLVVETICLSQENSRVQISLFSSRDGLSDSRITVLFKDSRGYLWVGTANGLNRYDGYGFRKYAHRFRDTATIAGNCIRDIQEDSQGNLWILTDRGVCRKDINKEEFVHFFSAKENQKTNDTGVTHLLVTGSGEVWLSGLSGLQRFDKRENRFVKISGQGEHGDGRNRTGLNNTSFLCDTAGGFYVLSAGGEKVLAHYEVPEAGKIHFITPAFFTEKLIIGSEKGLFLYDPLDRETILLNIPGRENAKVTAFYPEKKRVWLAIDGAIYSLGPGQDFPQKRYTAPELQNTRITSVWRDRTGILWVGTGKGLVKICEKHSPFTLWPVVSSKERTRGAQVSAVLSQDTRIWAGTVGDGIYLLDRTTGKVLRHYYAEALDSMSRMTLKKVYCFLQDKRGLVWTGTENGLKVFNRRKNSFIPAGDYFGIKLPDTLPVFSMDTTFDGDIWFGSAGEVYRLAGNMQYLKKYTFQKKPASSDSLPGIYTICQTPDTRIWVGGDNFLGRIEPVFNEIIVLNDFPEEEMNIYRILGSSPDTLWVVTDKGLGMITVNPFSFTVFEDEALTNTSFYAGIMDRRKTIWLGSGNGLVRYNTGFGDFGAMKADFDGELHFNPGGQYVSPEGAVFFGGDGFVLGFHPDSLLKSSSFPKVVIESVRYLSGKDWNDAPVADKIIIRSENLNLLELAFKALDFTDPAGNRIMYMIRGDDDQWHIIPGTKKVYLTDLRNRTYSVYVRSSGSAGEWSAPRLLMTFRTTNLFRFVYIVIIVIFLIILGLVLVYIDYRTRSLIETNKLLKEKEKIAQKLEEQRDRLNHMYKDLTDSIRYAQKIQQALLPSDYFFHKLLPESFILFLPRDIVSGDFYWINKKEGKVFFTVADCTGHGVPGAFMSMIGFQILDKIIKDQGVVHPDEALNILNHGIINTFSHGEDDMLVKDGMDISFCTLDREKMILEFAGAFHVLYLVRENTLMEFKGDRVSVGFRQGEDGDTFTRHEIKLEKGDRIYLFTDGYPDQFGGPAKKKFMYRRFRHLLLSIHQLPMWQQQYILHERFQDWKGDLFQVDDVLVIGVDPCVYKAGPGDNKRISDLNKTDG